MIWASALLVFGTLGVILANLGAEDGDLRLGYEQMIHANVPWIFLLLLWAGVALGLFAALRKRGPLRWILFGLELAPVALVSWYVLSFSYLPAHPLAVDVGDAFPAYELANQDGEPVRYDGNAGQAREPALYIFYRGDW